MEAPIIIRIQGGLDNDTHQTNYFRLAMDQFYSMMFTGIPMAEDSYALKIADPYARNCRIAGEHTNDIDPDTDAKFHLDALDFLCSLDSGKFHGVIFDPPFSTECGKRKYEHGAVNIYTVPGAVKAQMKEIERVLKPGGYLLKFGFNTSRHQGGFDLLRVWIVNHGSNHNDTLVSLWKKVNHDLGEWI